MPGDNKDFFVPPQDITPQSPLKIESPKYSSNTGQLLVRCMADAYSADPEAKRKSSRYATDYDMDQSGVKHLHYDTCTSDEFNVLVENYRRDPKEACGAVRANLIRISQDERLPESERQDRLHRYLRTYLEIISTLDRLAFPPDSDKAHVYHGVPAYIPDGFSDMGKDPTIDSQERDREKTRVDKRASYRIAEQDLFDTIWSLRNSKNFDPSSSEVKKYIIGRTMVNVHQAMPYDFINYGGGHTIPGGSIPIHDRVTSKDPDSVCRHIAMETQLRLQALGIESRLLKCNLDGVAHVANLVRINSKWHLADPTNPESHPDKPVARVYLREIQNYNPKDPNPKWTFDRYYVKTDTKEIKKIQSTYTPHNFMYYRIIDNVKYPATGN